MAQSRLRKLGYYLRPHWRQATVGILALFVVNALSIYIVVLIGNTIDYLRESSNFDQILRQVVLKVLLIVVLSCLMWAIRMVSRIALFGTGRQVEFDLKQKIFQHLLQLEPSYFATSSAGDLINRATSDVENIRRLLGFAVLSLANTVFAYALTLPVMLSISVELTLASIAFYPFMLILVHLFSNRLRNEQIEVQEKLSDISQLIQEDMSGMALIKIYAQEQNERRAFRQNNRELLAANLKLAKTRNTIFPLVGGIAYISLLTLMWLGAGRLNSGAISVGDFVKLVQFVERLVFPTTLLGFTITTYQRGEVSIDRIESILSIKPKIKDSINSIEMPPERVMGKLEARHLSYTYPGSATPALQDINFTVEPGETVAVVGPIGSGKSTLANAIPHLLNIEPGQLFLDGKDITQLKLHDLRQAIAYVPQDSFLFSTTIKNNIRYGDPLTEQSEVEYSAKQAQIHPEISTFPQHYETIVGERGITLSGGQRQRTALARALLIDAPVLILDDALSSVDNQTATEILNNLSQGNQRKTVIFISHQLSAAATSDRILVMDRGQIVQSGTHAELLVQSGLYQSLWNQHKLEEILQ